MFGTELNDIQYVTLKLLALYLLAMPASQAFAEWVFSITGDLTRARHNRARVQLCVVVLCRK